MHIKIFNLLASSCPSPPKYSPGSPNDICLISCIIFHPWLSGYSALTFHPCPLVKHWGKLQADGSQMSASQLKIFLISWLFLTHYVAGYFPLSSIPSLKHSCWLMGPRCQLLGTRNVWYLHYFLPLILRDIWKIQNKSACLNEESNKRALSLWIVNLNEKVPFHRTNMIIAYNKPEQLYTIYQIFDQNHRCCWWVPHVSLLVQKNLRYLDYSLPVILPFFNTFHRTFLNLLSSEAEACGSNMSYSHYKL